MQKVIVIAEAGVNHNGDIILAKRLIDVAEEAGADYVKFQTFQADLIVTPTATKATYQALQDKEQESQFQMLKKLEMSLEMHKDLIWYCKNRKIKFLSTAFDIPSLKLLLELGIQVLKVPSGEITNLPYLEMVGRQKLEIILSTGMSEIQEVQEALDVLIQAGTTLNQITVLHCTSEYPAPISSVNLNAMREMGKKFSVKYGYSDHTTGIEVAIAATALGATVIEKHFTLDKTLPGPDHKASLGPEELKSMIKGIRKIEEALGSACKKPSLMEMENRLAIRKSIVAIKNIQKGEKFNIQNIGVKRPGFGMTPMCIPKLLGEIATRDYIINDLIRENL